MFDELAQIIEQNKKTVANYIAEEAYARKMASYTDKPKAEIARLVMPTVEMVARYIRTSDPTEYRKYIHDLTVVRLQQGYGIDDFYLMAEVLVDGVKQILDAQLSTTEQSRQKERFLRRLQGLQTLGQSTITAAQFDFHK